MKISQYLDKPDWSKKDGIITVKLATEDLYLKRTLKLLAFSFFIISLISLSFNPLLFFINLLTSIFCMLVGFGEQLKIHYFKVTNFEFEMIQKMGHFLKTNNLYLKEDSKIHDSVVMTLQNWNHGFIVSLLSGGNKFSDKILEMENELQNLFNLRVVDKIQNLNRIDYYLTPYIDTQLYYSRPTFFNVYCEGRAKIPITEDLIWNLDQAPHALIAGGTGSGKTYFLFHLLFCAKRHSCTVRIIDPKNADLFNLIKLKNFDENNVVSEIPQACRLLRETREEMDHRYQYIFDSNLGSNYRDAYLYPYILFFDEFAALFSACTKKEAEEAFKNLRQIIFKGRQAGVFVILSTQKPDADAIPTAIRDQLGLRVALGNMTADSYRMVFGRNDLSTYQNCSCGEGYLYFDGQKYNTPQYFKTPRIDNWQEFILYLEKYN